VKFEIHFEYWQKSSLTQKNEKIFPQILSLEVLSAKLAFYTSRVQPFTSIKRYLIGYGNFCVTLSQFEHTHGPKIRPFLSVPRDGF